MSDIAWIAHPLILSVKALFCSFLLLISIGLAIAYFLAFSKAKFKKIVEILVIFRSSSRRSRQDFYFFTSSERAGLSALR